ncbi:MAG: hypothetical protein JSW40_02635 [Candidatus Omnitrophota bacterium]|nr:MAG: hypothetical protein JSW40_02635 [Candidatus Omnitrophota bacterium]
MRSSRYGLRNSNSKKGLSVLEYAFLIAVVVGVLITMQVYLKRSIGGRLQVAGDMLGDPYAYGLTDLHEHFSSHTWVREWKFPGPADVIKTRGSFHYESERKLRPLEESSTLAIK